MDRRTGKLYIVFGTIWLAMSVVLVFISPVKFVAFAGAIAAVSLIVAGYNSKNIENTECDINKREELMIKSFLPGFVQLKYFKNNMGIIQLVLFVVGLILTIAGMFYVFSYDTNVPSEDFGPLYNGLMIFLYGIVIAIFSVVWSGLEVNEYCNKKGMPRTGGIFEMKCNNTELGMRLLVVSTFAILALLTIGFYLGEIL